MVFEKFINEVELRLKDLLGSEYTITSKEMTYNNGEKNKTFILHKEGNITSPIINMDLMYQEYVCGEYNLEQITERIYNLYVSNVDKCNLDVQDIMDWDKAKPNIYPKLVNAEKNKMMLEDVPHRTYLDLVILYYIQLDDCVAGDRASILINNRIMKLWGVDEEYLYDVSRENLYTKDRYSLKSMKTVLNGLLRTEDDELDQFDNYMYVLCNTNNTFGAINLINKSAMQIISSKLDTDLIILPSSIYELIILPAREFTEDIGVIRSMVEEINSTVLSGREFLSNHVYRYSREKEDVEIAA